MNPNFFDYKMNNFSRGSKHMQLQFNYSMDICFILENIGRVKRYNKSMKMIVTKST
jgi:hypothetical protein